MPNFGETAVSRLANKLAVGANLSTYILNDRIVTVIIWLDVTNPKSCGVHLVFHGREMICKKVRQDRVKMRQRDRQPMRRYRHQPEHTSFERKLQSSTG